MSSELREVSEGDFELPRQELILRRQEIRGSWSSEKYVQRLDAGENSIEVVHALGSSDIVTDVVSSAVPVFP